MFLSIVSWVECVASNQEIEQVVLLFRSILLTMMGTRVASTGPGVFWPSSSLDSTTLKTGSIVFTVCVREIATAAKDRLAAMWPMACMEAGQKMLPNSALLMGCM